MFASGYEASVLATGLARLCTETEAYPRPENGILCVSLVERLSILIVGKRDGLLESEES